MERVQLIVARRALIDRLTNILPECELFRANAFYPKRYFDDLMVQQNKEATLQRDATLERLSPRALNTNSSNALHLPVIQRNLPF